MREIDELKIDNIPEVDILGNLDDYDSFTEADRGRSAVGNEAGEKLLEQENDLLGNLNPEDLGTFDSGRNAIGNEGLTGTGPILPGNILQSIEESPNIGKTNPEDRSTVKLDNNTMNDNGKNIAASDNTKKSQQRQAVLDINDGLKQADAAIREVNGWNFTPQIPQRSRPGLWRRFWTSFSTGFAKTAKAITNIVTAPVIAIRYTYAMKKLLKAADVMQERKNRDLIPGWGEGDTYERKLNDKGEENGWDMLSDFRRVPVVWSYMTAEEAADKDGSPLPPEVSVFISQPREGSSRSFDGTNMGHAMIGIHYSRKNRSTNRIDRYRIQYGFYPAGGTTGVAMSELLANHNAVFPGMLKNDRNHNYTISRRYKATEEQVGKILLASEQYSSKGYGYYKRNCTTFVRDMVEKEAGLDTGGQIFEQEKVRYNFLYNFLRAGAGFFGSYFTASAMSQLADMSNSNDNSYQGFGNKRVNLEDIKNYWDSRDEKLADKTTYIPGVTGENLRRVSGNTDIGGDLGSYKYAGTMGEEAKDAKVNFAKLVENVTTEGKKMTEAMRSILPEGQEIPAELQSFLTGLNYLNSRMQLYSLQMDVEDAIQTVVAAAQQNGKEVAVNEYTVPYNGLDLSKLRFVRQQLQNDSRAVNDIYSRYFKGDLRINKQIMNYLSILQIGMNYIDTIYVGSEAGNMVFDKFELTRDQMYQNRVEIYAGGLTAKMSPSLYEGYLQIFKTPEEAVKKYLEYLEIDSKNRSDMNSAEERRLDQALRFHQLAVDFSNSHNYMLEKESYGKQEIEHIFRLASMEKQGGATVGIESDYTSSASRIYKTRLYEMLFGDIQSTWDKSEAEGGRPFDSTEGKDNDTDFIREADRKWLLSYFQKKFDSNKDTFVAIATALKKSEPDNDNAYYIETLALDLWYNVFQGFRSTTEAHHDMVLANSLRGMFNREISNPASGLYQLFVNLFNEVKPAKEGF